MCPKCYIRRYKIGSEIIIASEFKFCNTYLKPVGTKVNQIINLTKLY